MDGETPASREEIPKSNIPETNSSQEINQQETNKNRDKQGGKDFIRDEIKTYLDETRIQTKKSPEALAGRHSSMGERLTGEAWVEGVDIAQIQFDEKYIKGLDRIESKGWTYDKKDQ